MSWLTALGLCVAGLAAIIVEFFVPAAGIIGIVGFGSIVSGIVVAYNEYGNLVGSLFLIGAVVVTPFVIALYFKFFPRSFIGRWLILGGRVSAQSKSDSDGLQDEAVKSVGSPDPSNQPEEPLGALIGKRGKAVSILRPAGTIEIEGRKYSGMTGGEFVDRGSAVLVTRVRGNRIHVRSIDPS